MRSFLLALLLIGAPAWAASPFIFPLDCDLGATCTVMSYQDTQERAGDIADPACGMRTKDNQIGTYFALPNLRAMKNGVAVRAVADGDVELAQDGAKNNPGGECGNGLRLRHKSGWKSFYCGLAQGSVALKQGQSVKQGQVIGMAGFSGPLSAPGLAFTLER